MDILDEFDCEVAVRDVSGSHSVIQLPRNESLRIVPKMGMLEMYDSLVACETLSKTTLERGESKRIFCDGESGGYPLSRCVGVQAARTGGVIDRTTYFSALSDKHWKQLLKMTGQAEAAPLESFANTSIIQQLTAAKQIVPFKTFSSLNSEDTVKYFGAIEFGCNMFLRCHTDKDFP